MKRTVIAALALLIAFSVCACKGGAEEPAPTPAASETPMFEQPVVMEVAKETPVPAETPPAGLYHLLASEGDVEAVLGDIDLWDGFSVVTEEFGGQTMFSVLPAEAQSEDPLAAIPYIGAVVMSYDENKITALSAKVYLDVDAEYAGAAERLYDYFRDSFAYDTITGVDEGQWESVKTALDMRYANAVSGTALGAEIRELFGKFVYVYAGPTVSFDFYMD